MNIYLLSNQNKGVGGIYSSMVIAAKNKTDAKYLALLYLRMLTTDTNLINEIPIWRNYFISNKDNRWTLQPKFELLGKAKENLNEGVICTQFESLSYY